MRGAQLVRFARRVERIRQQQQSVRHGVIFRRRHRRLPAAIGMPACEDTSRHQMAKGSNGGPDTFPVGSRIGRTGRTS
jgi:hypothetical protein